MPSGVRSGKELLWIVGLGVGAGCLGVGAAVALDPVPSTLTDFFLQGSQPLSLTDPLQPVTDNCAVCHGNDQGVASLPYNRWHASMMAQSARDPIFHACLTIANQDAAFAGDLCLRCHTPGGWIEGRSTPTDGSMLAGADFEGVSCSVCHRMVDPVYVEGVSPAEDQQVLADLEVGSNGVPINPHTANYVLDPLDRRRGPLDLDADWPGGFFWHQWLYSPLHSESRMCATCHDVSNPMYVRQPNGTYALGDLDAPHPTQDKYDQFPVERTYSEWSASLFADGPVDLDGRFGGNRGESVSSCQDCHMPTTSGTACVPFLGPPERNDIPVHNFNGANSWVLRAVRALYPDAETGLSDQSVTDALARNEQMLNLAGDLEVTRSGGTLNVRIVNFTGHKLPTGYHEGRRMWVNVQFLNGNGDIIAERGAYDPATATLNAADTKVYEAKMGVDAAVSALTGIPEGESFHFAVNNVIEFDNRIPPMGFTHAGFAAVQAAPVGYTYADGQYWDDTEFAIPAGSRSAVVCTYHQTTSKEYITFLRDANTTNNKGQVAYDLWQQFGMSAPVRMDYETILIPCAADFNGSGAVTSADITSFLSAWFADLANGTLYADFNASGYTTSSDITAFLNAWFAALAGGC
ncbi:MAG: hypothetical protein H7Y88_01765 [Phycisphaerales bacterium]|nr:hypothetical protein [Phycisphaerales bacterium]